jgi:uncharacterized protein
LINKTCIQNYLTNYLNIKKMKATKKTGLVLSVVALGMLFGCSKDEEVGTPNDQSAIEQPSTHNKECSFVDNNWSSSAVLSNTIGSSAETSFMRSQNSKIAAVWGRPSVALSFVKDPRNPNSTFNAISYSNGKIYYGEAIYRAAKSKNANNIANAMILAHEFGHQLQYTFGLPSVQENTVRSGELEADAMAGYYLGRPYGFNAGSFPAIAAAYEFAASIGDNLFNNPNHHGTAPQRRSAVRLGWLLSDYDMDAEDFDYTFFYYYDDVLDGNWKQGQAAPKGIRADIHARMSQYIQELKDIKSGKMSIEEYNKLQ